MLSAIRGAWALLLGIALIMVGNGLQGTLLGVRAGLEGFTPTTTGFVMTGFFAGFLLGSTTVPRFVNTVGHIRVFAALASLASAAVLLHSIVVEPWTWAAIRLLTGFAFAGLYVVAESWLNDAATNETRGQLLSVYMVIVLGGMATGQLLLNVADPGGATLFILVSVLVSLAVMPITLTASRAPAFDAPDHLGLAALYAISPLGVVGAIAGGVAQAAIWSMGAVYAGELGLSVREISYFMTALLVGAMLMQWPIGQLSDRFDRRKIITVASFCASALALAMALVGGSSYRLDLVLFALVGGTVMPLYSVFIAYTNDHLEPKQMVAASAGMVLANGIGLSLGPASAGVAMNTVGPPGLFFLVAAIMAGTGAFALWRMSQRDAPAMEDQRHYGALSPRSSVVAATVSLEAVRDSRDRDLARLSPR